MIGRNRDARARAAVGERAASFVDRERLAAHICEIINISSPTGEEYELAKRLHDDFTEMGLRATLQEIDLNQANVIGRLEGTEPGPTLLLLGHLDTTWSGSEEGIRDLGDGYQPAAKRDGDWIFGMGAYNMKSGFAAAIEAVRAVVDSGVRLPGEVVLAGVASESPKAQVGPFQGPRFRGAGKGARFLVNNGVAADFCVVTEPTNGAISVVSGGYVLIEIVTKGYPGATYKRTEISGAPEPVDAIERMRHVHEEIRKWGEAYSERTRFREQIENHVAIISVEGGLPYRPSKQPAYCRSVIEIGFMPGQRAIDVIREVTCVLEPYRSRDDELDLDINVLQTAPGALVDPDEPIVSALSDAHEEEHGDPPRLSIDGWLADTTHLTRYGIPAVCYGPAGRVREGGLGYFSPSGEQCFLPDIEMGARVLARLIASVCSSDVEVLPRKVDSTVVY